MADIRIKVAKDKAELLKALQAKEDTPGTFQSYADALVFAAALGMKRGRREPIAKYSDIDPIRQDIFQNRGYDQVINLLAVVSSNNPKILASTDEAEAERVKIFEEYANAGLEILEGVLKGSVNHTKSLLMFLRAERETKDVQEDEEFDLSRFIN
ncbi:DNA phosphorothioation-associated protein 4 [Thermoleptolyngbya sp.]